MKWVRFLLQGPTKSSQIKQPVRKASLASVTWFHNRQSLLQIFPTDSEQYNDCSITCIDICTPRDGDNGPCGRSEPRQRALWSVLLKHSRVCSHSRNRRKDLFLTVLKPTDQVQQVLLLVEECLSEALGSQVLSIQPVNLVSKQLQTSCKKTSTVNDLNRS